MSTRVLAVVVGVLAAALVASVVVVVVQDRRLTDVQAELEALRAERDSLATENERLRDDTDAGGGLLDGLLGGDGAPDLGGLLDGLLGDGEGLEGLLGGSDGSSVAGVACLQPEDDGAGFLDDPLGALGGLFGGGGGEVADDPDQLVDRVADEVAALRALDWEHDVEVAFVDDAELRQRLGELLDEGVDRDHLVAQQRLWTSLGALRPGTDLEAVQRELLADQVAGYYVPDTGELVVRTPPDGIGPADQVTLAHELLHALTDQALGLPDEEEARFADDPDAWLGALAVIEGDATLVMSQWAMQHLGLAAQLSIATDPAVAAAQESLDELPYVVVQELLFPYEAGLDHVCDRYLDGGWTAVDRLYADPPSTTWEVLHGQPREPAVPAVLGAPAGEDAELLTEATFGAAHLTWLLEAPGDDPARALDDPAGRARAWAGGQSAVWQLPDGSTATGLALVDGGDAPVSLCSTVEDWIAAAFPDADRVDEARGITRTYRGADRTVVLRCDDADVALGIARSEIDAAHLALGRR